MLPGFGDSRLGMEEQPFTPTWSLAPLIEVSAASLGRTTANTKGEKQGAYSQPQPGFLISSVLHKMEKGAFPC